MRRWLVLRWLAVLALVCAMLCAQPRPAPNWTATGSVTDSITGQPLAGAAVIWEPSYSGYGFRDRPAEVSGPAPNAARAVTDAAGVFTLSLEPTATGVRLFVSHPGYRAQDGKPSAILALRANSPPASIKLVPQSTIQGRVTNTAGDPLAGIQITLARIQIRDGRRQARETFARASGADGTYQFDDLPPGAYYLRAAGSVQKQAPDEACGPIYYPAASNQEEAQLLRGAPGKSIRADFHLESHKAYRIHGLIANMPLRKPVEVRLLRGDDPLSNVAVVGPNGAFDVLGVAPGSYTLQAYTPNILPLDFGEAEVTVENRDLPGIRITLAEGVDIAGHIEFRGSGSLEKYAVLYATPLNPRRWPGDFKEPVATMRANGDFLFKNLLPGEYDIAVRGLPSTYLADIRAQSRDRAIDVMERGLTVPAKDPPTLAIVMKAGGGEISGNIEGAAPGDLFAVALVVTHGVANIPTLLRAPAGHFHIDSLTPGDYTLLAWPESREMEYRNPAVLTELMRYGISVSLADGARREVTLTPMP